MGRCSDTVGAARGTSDKVGSLDCSKCTVWAEMPFRPRMRLTVGGCQLLQGLGTTAEGSDAVCHSSRENGISQIVCPRESLFPLPQIMGLKSKIPQGSFICQMRLLATLVANGQVW